MYTFYAKINELEANITDFFKVWSLKLYLSPKNCLQEIEAANLGADFTCTLYNDISFNPLKPYD